MRNIRRTSVSTAAAALLALGAVGAPVQAGEALLQIVFRASPDNCVQGTANDTFDLQLRDHANHLLETVPAVVPDPDTTFIACFGSNGVEPRMRLKATNGESTTGSVSFTIPTLTVDTDRVTDIVKGAAPHDRDVRVRLYDCNHLDFACKHKSTRTVHVNGAGHYSKDMSSTYDARGFDEARVTYTTSAGHSYTVITIFPWLAVVPTDDQVFGESRGGQKVTIRLYSAPGGTLLTKRSKVVPFADFNFFLNSHTSTGRQVTGSFASDAKLTIPSTHISTEVVGTDTILHVRCLRDRPVMVDFNPGVDRIYHTDTHGTVDVNVTQDAPGVDLSVDGVRLTCQSAAGDVVTRYFLPPVQ